MSKFCPMCNEVTNCTENCKYCFEEEKKEQGDFDFVVQYGNQKPHEEFEEKVNQKIQEDVLRTRVNLQHHKE